MRGGLFIYFRKNPPSTCLFIRFLELLKFPPSTCFLPYNMIFPTFHVWSFFHPYLRSLLGSLVLKAPYLDSIFNYLNWVAYMGSLFRFHILDNHLGFLGIPRKRVCPGCSATGMGQFPICKLKWDLLRTSVTACTMNKNTFSAPFGIFYVRTEVWKQILQKKSYATP